MHTLTLNNDLWVEGSDGSFQFTTNGTISIAAAKALTLSDLGQPSPPTNEWSDGSIRGGMGSSFVVSGTYLKVSGAPDDLGTDLIIQQSPILEHAGDVFLVGMTTNLPLSGSANIILVKNGGNLDLLQSIDVNQQPNTVGGISFQAAHTDPTAVVVLSGGKLSRSAVPIPNAPANSVSIAGAIYNKGGLVRATVGGQLAIIGKDPNNCSYSQTDASSAKLEVDVDSKISAAGTFTIDIGTVQLTAKSGGTVELLAGAGLIFGNANDTILKILDSTEGTPGALSIQGPVTLGQKTTTMLNFKGSNNTADQIQVKNGALTLNGTLALHGYGGVKPNVALDFFSDSEGTPAINGAFTTITDDVGGTDTGQVVTVGQVKYYRVTIQ